MFFCEDEVVSSIERCPMLVPGGVRCNREATIIPQAWELPPYCVPGKPVCSKCYQELRAKALGIRDSRAA